MNLLRPPNGPHVTSPFQKKPPAYPFHGDGEGPEVTRTSGWLMMGSLFHRFLNPI